MGKTLREVIGTLYRLEFPDGKSYIGACLCTASRRYHRHKRLAISGDTAPIHDAWRRLGPPQLIILSTGIARLSIWQEEKKAIRLNDTIAPHGYNAKSGSDKPPGHLGKPGGMLGKKHSDAARQKMTRSSLGKPGTNLGKRFSVEHKERIRQANLGKTHSAKSIERMRAAHRGAVCSDEHKEKIRKAMMGRPSPMRGRKHTEETKAKMRLARLRRKVEIDDQQPA